MATQPTMDGAPAPPTPPAPKKRGRPRLPPHLQTLAHELARARAARRRAHHNGYVVFNTRRHRRLRKSTSPSLSLHHFTTKHKMDNLLDWHATCHASHAYDTPDEEHYTERDGPPDDPPELKEPTMVTHHDE